MKCKDCEHSTTSYDYDWLCAWRAICHKLGTEETISEYTEDDTNEPDWDVDLGRGNHYCAYHEPYLSLGTEGKG